MDQGIAQADSSYRKFKTIMFKADFADSALQLQGTQVTSEQNIGSARLSGIYVYSSLLPSVNC